MEPLTILIAVAGIVATGALSKIGENITDEVLSKSNEVLSQIRRKSPNTAVLIKNAGKNINYAQVYLEIEAIANDLETKRLLQEMMIAVLAERKVAQIVKQELNKANPLLATVIENWKGINIKGGNNTITGNIFQF